MIINFTIQCANIYYIKPIDLIMYIKNAVRANSLLQEKQQTHRRNV